MLLSKRCVLARHTGGYPQCDGSSIAWELLPFTAGTQTAYLLSPVGDVAVNTAVCQGDLTILFFARKNAATKSNIKEKREITGRISGKNREIILPLSTKNSRPNICLADCFSIYYVLESSITNLYPVPHTV